VEDVLHWSPEAIEQLQAERLQRMLALCAQGHPYYRRKWAEAGVDIAAIRSIGDLQRLPLTPKQDLMAEPEAFRLHLPDLPLHERVLWEVMYTTGSTGDPTPIYNTTHDYRAYLLQAKRVAAISDLRESDHIANLFPLTAAPMGAYLRAATSTYAAGASIFAALPGAPIGTIDVNRSLDEAVGLIERHRATVLWGVTSFVRRVLLRAIERNADFRSVRMCAVTGEASTPAGREELRRALRTLGAAGTKILDRYGSTELGALAQCREEDDWHNPIPDFQAHEVVDRQTGQCVPDGERGELALTYLDRRGTVLIRFLVGDVVSLARTPCPHCGRTGDRVVGPVVRTKDLVKVKGMLINPTVLLETLKRIDSVEEFQVVVRRERPDEPLSMDEMVVRVATRSADRDALARTIVARVQEAVQIRPRVEFAAAQHIYDPSVQTKAVRFVDAR
jgi:phenylacetate-coenzyme A ligase PaaK-like adenylate-forming protein